MENTDAPFCRRTRCAEFPRLGGRSPQCGMSCSREIFLGNDDFSDRTAPGFSCLTSFQAFFPASQLSQPRGDMHSLPGKK